MTVRKLDRLIVVFDSATARFFEQTQEGRLRPLTEWESGLHAHVRDLVTDKPGRGFASSRSGTRHAYEAPGDLHKLEKHKFVQLLVRTLDDAFDQGAFLRLVIVAPERSMGEFHQLAPAKLRRLVELEVPKELAQLTDAQLEERLRPMLEGAPEGARHS